MRQKKFKYVWNKGSRFSSLDTDMVVKEVTKISKRIGRHPNAEDVLDAATDPKSPLYHAFDWDDSSAARKHRLETARKLLQGIRIIVEVENKPPIIVPAHVALAEPGEPLRRYVPVHTAMEDYDMRQQVLKHAMAELKAFRARYHALTELAGVIDAIDKLKLK